MQDKQKLIQQRMKRMGLLKEAPPLRLLDKDMRDWFFEKHPIQSHDYMYIEEFGISNVRADIVKLFRFANDGTYQLEGLEIKSSSDTLTRLAMQSMQYARYFDRCSLIVHTHLLKDALLSLPAHWGVIELYKKYGLICHKEIRPARTTPTGDYAEFDFLFREEVLNILRADNLQSGVTRVDKDILIQRVKDYLTPQEFRQRALEAVFTRKDWRRRDPKTLHSYAIKER